MANVGFVGHGVMPHGRCQLAALIAGFNLFLARSLSRNATDQARARASAQVELLDVTRAGVSATERPDEAAPDVPVWVYSGSRAIEAPRASARLAADVGRRRSRLRAGRSGVVAVHRRRVTATDRG